MDFLMPSKDQLVSIIIPTYNRANMVSDAVLSAINQTYSGPIEVIVVDDGSTDATQEIISKLMNSHNCIRYYRQSNAGPSAARNLGIREARGNFIQFLDSDDLLYQDKIAKQIQSLKLHPSVQLSTCWAMLVRNSESQEEAISSFPPRSQGPILPDFFKFAFLLTSTPIYRIDIVKTVGYWNEKLRTCEDWEWHVRMGLKGATYIEVAEPLVKIRLHDQGRLSDGALSKDPRILSDVECYLDSIGNAYTIDMPDYRNYLSKKYWQTYLEFAAQGCLKQAINCRRKAMKTCVAPKQRLIYRLLTEFCRNIGIVRSAKLWMSLRTSRIWKELIGRNGALGANLIWLRRWLEVH